MRAPLVLLALFVSLPAAADEDRTDKHLQDQRWVRTATSGLICYRQQRLQKARAAMLRHVRTTKIGGDPYDEKYQDLKSAVDDEIDWIQEKVNWLWVTLRARPLGCGGEVAALGACIAARGEATRCQAQRMRDLLAMIDDGEFPEAPPERRVSAREEVEEIARPAAPPPKPTPSQFPVYPSYVPKAQ